MSDRDDECTDQAPPTPVDPADGELLFRHTFLWRLRNPADREALLRLGAGFDDYMAELGCWGEGPMVPGMAGALAADVESLATYARTIAKVGHGSKVDEEEIGIVYFAPRWAETLAALAFEIRNAESLARRKTL